MREEEKENERLTATAGRSNSATRLAPFFARDYSLIKTRHLPETENKVSLRLCRVSVLCGGFMRTYASTRACTLAGS